MATHHPSLLSVWIRFTAALVGCRSSQEIGDVRGMITIGDEPLDSVMVYFMPDPGEQTIDIDLKATAGIR